MFVCFYCASYVFCFAASYVYLFVVVFADGATAGAAARVAAGADAEATAGAAGLYHSCARHVHVIKVSFLGPISTLRHDTRIFLM